MNKQRYEKTLAKRPAKQINVYQRSCFQRGYDPMPKNAILQNHYSFLRS